MKNPTLFDDTPRLNMRDSIRMTQETLVEYRRRFDNWQISWSGGKDSTATLTLIVWMIDSCMVEAPRRLRVLYADTRDAYGGNEAEEINARTGCICCPLAEKDTALDTIISMPRWRYLAPLKELRRIYAEMRSPLHRLRQPGTQLLKDGSIPDNPNRMGPLTVEARKTFFERIIQIQETINNDPRCHRPIDILNQEEADYIRTCWETNLYPNGWTGDEPSAALPFEQRYKDGSVQKILFGE